MRNAAGWDEALRRRRAGLERGAQPFRRRAGARLCRRAGPSTWPPVKDATACGSPGSAGRVTAVDFSQVGLAKGRRLAERPGARPSGVTCECADLTAYVPEPAAATTWCCWPTCTCRRRIGRSIVRRAADAVAPGGTLLIVGHDLANLERGVGGPQDPDVLYTADRLRDAIAGAGLTVDVSGGAAAPGRGPSGPPSTSSCSPAGVADLGQAPNLGRVEA